MNNLSLPPVSPRAGRALLIAGLFALGLLLGWLVIGWWLWPVSWSDALPVDLAPAEKQHYTRMAAESYAANGDAALASARLASWPAADQQRILSGAGAQSAAGVSPAAATGAGPAAPARRTNILVLGTDARPTWEAWRTDSIMVLSLDEPTGQVGIMSFPRDLYVEMPGGKWDRLNVVDYLGEKNGYPGGGPALVAQVLSDTLGVQSDHWVRIQMDGIIKLVDSLDGVTVKLDCPLYERAPDKTQPSGYRDFNLPAGESRLDGADAKRFATFRTVTSDLGRQRRQQQLIWALRNEFLQLDTLTKIPQLWSALGETFTTDLGLPDVLRLAQFARNLNPERVHGMVMKNEWFEDITTTEGAIVLKIADMDAFRAARDQLFSGTALADLDKPDPEKGCPPPPPPP
jgi:LCP family protein required for cell wall assembly